MVFCSIYTVLKLYESHSFFFFIYNNNRKQIIVIYILYIILLFTSPYTVTVGYPMVLMTWLKYKTNTHRKLETRTF